MIGNRQLVMVAKWAVAVCAGTAWAQNAELSGLIQDPSTTVIAGAEVSIRNEQTGGRRIARTSSEGFYSFFSLNPGEYRVTVRAAGFETMIRDGIRLEVSETARIDFILRLGDVRTEVTVHGGPPLIDTENASVGTIIDRDIIDKMPLNGRGIQSLIELSPGVVVVPQVSSSAGQFVVNGQRSDANYVSVDGISANFGIGASLNPTPGDTRAGSGTIPANNFLGTLSNLVSPESLQEFKIQTSTFAPEFGRTPGAQIGLVTRSGTNRYSGSLFEYFRNDKFDATDWFADANAAPKPSLRFNNFGGSLGGPVRIPHLYNGHDRTFFFFSAEGVVMAQPGPTVPTLVPSLEARQNAPPLVALLLNAFPLPNRSAGDSTTPGFSTFAKSSEVRNEQQTYGLRLDHAFNDRLLFFVRYNRAPSSRSLPAATPVIIGKYAIGTDTLTFGLTQIITPRMVNEIRLNGSVQSASATYGVDRADGAQAPPDWIFFPPGYSSKDSEARFGIYPSDQMVFGSWGQYRSRQIQAVDNLAYSGGSHQLKFGVDTRWLIPTTLTERLDTYFAFFHSIYGETGAYSGLNSGALYTYNLTPRHTYIIGAFSAYAQDTWRASHRLTLTYGLRWEVDPAPRDTEQSAIITDLTNPNDPSTGRYVPAGKPFYATSWSNLAPRLGTAWLIHDATATKTVLRAGAGRFFDLGQAAFDQSGYKTPTLSYYSNQPLGSLTGGLLQVTSTDSIGFGTTAIVPAPDYRLPFTWQWNVTIEQSVGQQTLSAGYVGALGRRLISWVIPPRSPAFASVFRLDSDGDSSYHSLQLQFNRRLSSRLHILVSYTWSHSIDNVSNDWPFSPESADFQPMDPRKKGPSDFDLRHSLNGSVIATLPSPRGGITNVFLRNWTANSIFFARSALPTDLLAYEGDSYGRPDVIPGQPLYLYGSRFAGGKSYNRAAFSIPPNGRDGDLGRNVLRGFDAWQIDFALQREFLLSERIKMQFRAEAFNILNHPNFANPSDPGNPGILSLDAGPGFGSTTQTLATGLGPNNVLGQLSPLFQIGGPRSMQFAVRLRF